jgi:DNA-binding XRE family transcriptional regulator
MATSFKTLREQMSPERRARVEARTKKLLAEMPLHELRQALHLSQQRLSEILGLKQSSISKVENQTDMYVSTLRSYIEALGGELQIVANLPTGTVYITRFDKIQAPAKRATGSARPAGAGTIVRRKPSKATAARTIPRRRSA